MPVKFPRPRRAVNARGYLKRSLTLIAAGSPNRLFIESYQIENNKNINKQKYNEQKVLKELNHLVRTFRRAAATDGRLSICCANLRFLVDANCCIIRSPEVEASLFFRILVKL